MFSNYEGVGDDDTASLEFEKHLGLHRLNAFESVQDYSYGRSQTIVSDQVLSAISCCSLVSFPSTPLICPTSPRPLWWVNRPFSTQTPHPLAGTKMAPAGRCADTVRDQGYASYQVSVSIRVSPSLLSFLQTSEFHN